jgi:hypothetical protein
MVPFDPSDHNTLFIRLPSEADAVHVICLSTYIFVLPDCEGVQIKPADGLIVVELLLFVLSVQVNVYSVEEDISAAVVKFSELIILFSSSFTEQE